MSNAAGPHLSDTLSTSVRKARCRSASPDGAGGTGGALAAGAGDTERLLAIVVDDLGLSFESVERLRGVLHGFVNAGIDAGVRLAIVRTSGSGSAPQSFTSDRRIAAAAVERVRYSPRSRTGVSSSSRSVDDPGPNPLAPVRHSTSGICRTARRIRQEASSSGSVGALQALLRGLAPFPGRKSVLFISEGFDVGLTSADGRERRTRERRGGMFGVFARVVDTANRSGVVLYTLNPAGLLQTAASAQDFFRDEDGQLTPAELTGMVSGETRLRHAQLTSTQASLLALAEQTGGFAVVDSNALAAGLSRIEEDMRGYYLIGFEAKLDAKAPWSPNDVQLRVKRPGVTVRARRGLFGPANAATRPAREGDALVSAALSPFGLGTIDVKLTSLFGYDAKAGPFVHAALLVDPAGVRFSDTGDGRRQASVTLLVMAIGEDGVPVARIRRQVAMKLTPDDYRGVQQAGLRYSARVPIEKPGGSRYASPSRTISGRPSAPAPSSSTFPGLARDTSRSPAWRWSIATRRSRRATR